MDNIFINRKLTRADVAIIRAAIPDDLDLLPEDGEEKNRRLYRGNAASRARPLAADICRLYSCPADVCPADICLRP